MIKLLNNPTFDNERNILNADLFVNNLKNTLKAFNLHTKVIYTVYRNITIYNIIWNDDKTYEDVLELRKEIALSLGIRSEELEIKKVKDKSTAKEGKLENKKTKTKETKPKKTTKKTEEKPKEEIVTKKRGRPRKNG